MARSATPLDPEPTLEPLGTRLGAGAIDSPKLPQEQPAPIDDTASQTPPPRMPQDTDPDAAPCADDTGARPAAPSLPPGTVPAAAPCSGMGEPVPAAAPRKTRHRWYEPLMGWLGTRQLVPRASLTALRVELEGHLRDAEAALADKRRDLARLEDKRHGLEMEHQHLEEDHRRLDRDVQLALVESQDRLARFALCRALALRHKLERVGNELRSTEYRCEQLADLVARQQADWVALRKDAARAQGSREDTQGQRPLDPISQEEVELELLRRKRRLAQQGNRQKGVTDAGPEF